MCVVGVEGGTSTAGKPIDGAVPGPRRFTGHALSCALLGLPEGSAKPLILLVEAAHDRRDLALQQDEIAHHHQLLAVRMKASQEPSAKPGRISTPSNITFRSERGSARR